jgi:SAM-dependent methyltransferase
VTTSYDTLAAVYDWLVPETLLAPEGSAAAFAPYLESVAPGARVLDCACGPGHVAVGLALRGFDVTATDASGGMVERARSLAAGHGAVIEARRCAWDDLPGAGLAPFAAVLCVGNSLVHAPGREARRAALRAMAAVLDPGGVLVLTSRTWERVRAAGSGLHVEDRLVERPGGRGLVVHAWTIADAWDARHDLDVAVALIGDDGAVETHAERLSFWPFTQDELADDLRAAGLAPEASTFDPEVDRYLVTARR